jgi:hypothetical protein
LILASLSAGTIALPVILNAWLALKAETGMTDEQLAADTEARAAGLDARILSRLAEIENTHRDQSGYAVVGLLLFVMVLFQAATSLITGSETLALLVAGFVASFVQSAFKRYVNNDGGYGWFKGATAHFGTLLIAVLISLGVLAYQDQLHSWADVVKSAGIIVMSATSTFHFLIDKFGLIEAGSKRPG